MTCHLDGNVLFILSFLFVLLCYLLNFSHFWLILTLSVVVSLIGLYRKQLQIYVQTLPRDWKGIQVLFAVERDYKTHLRKGGTVTAAFTELVRKHPSKCAFYDMETNKSWSFQEVEELANKVSNYFSSKGYRANDVAALYAENSAKYVITWLGLSKIGIIAALINTNLKLELLAYSLKSAHAKFVIASKQMKPRIEACFEDNLLDKTIPVYEFIDQRDAENDFDADFHNSSITPPKLDRQIDYGQVLLYVFTSGTTGMPKPAVIKQIRYYTASRMAVHCFGVKPEDRLYVTMPLYHTAAGMLGVGLTLTTGCTSVIRRKFSASSFWDDCLDKDCTVSQYIGEICRYLLAQPSKPIERMHKIRLMYGNGMRKEFWQDFIDRFSVPHIGEVYGSTEGNATLANLDGTVGACGFLTVYDAVSDIYPVRLIRVDEKTSEPIRDKRGLCLKCRPGQHGQMVGKIIKNNPVKEFTGYVSEEETKKKLIRNVFSVGDVAFTSGDCLYMDEKGYLFFKDRCGDTFRWKGENVSTVEIEGVIQKLTGYADAVVYGVSVPGHDGKAGALCLAVDQSSTSFIKDLIGKFNKHLPQYAIPIFLRLKRQMEITGTFKYRKNQLQLDGFDPDKCGEDALFYLDKGNGEYKLLSVEVYGLIMKGSIKF